MATSEPAISTILTDVIAAWREAARRRGAHIEDATMDMLADPQPLADGLAALRAWLAREFSSPSIIAQTAAIAAAGVWRCSSHRGWRD